MNSSDSYSNIIVSNKLNLPSLLSIILICKLWMIQCPGLKLKVAILAHSHVTECCMVGVELTKPEMSRKKETLTHSI